MFCFCSALKEVRKSDVFGPPNFEILFLIGIYRWKKHLLTQWLTPCLGFLQTNVVGYPSGSVHIIILWMNLSHRIFFAAQRLNVFSSSSLNKKFLSSRKPFLSSLSSKMRYKRSIGKFLSLLPSLVSFVEVNRDLQRSHKNLLAYSWS